MKRILALSMFFLSLAVSQAQIQTLDINLENYTYPYPVSYLQLSSQQRQYRMAFMDVTSSQPNGKTILLLHGKNFNGAYWRETARKLVEAGYRVIIPDQIGFGKSSKAEHYQYTFQQLSLNTLELLDSLHVDQVTAVGHSMGGMLATRFTLMFPDRVSKLVLINPIGLEDWKQHVGYKPVDWWYANELKQNFESIKKYQLQNYYDGKWKPAYDEWVQFQAGWTTNKDYPRIAWNSALTYDMIFTQPVVHEFKNISKPTLLIIGQKDRTALGKNWADEKTKALLGNYPQLGVETQQKIKGSRLVKIHHVGHLPHIEDFRDLF
jgi:pimeloyl-ACP methyl ester carboxylesterase